MRPNYEDSTARPQPATPYDEPKKLWERLLFPSLELAYLQGYEAGLTFFTGVNTDDRTGTD